MPSVCLSLHLCVCLCVFVCDLCCNKFYFAISSVRAIAFPRCGAPTRRTHQRSIQANGKSARERERETLVMSGPSGLSHLCTVHFFLLLSQLPFRLSLTVHSHLRTTNCIAQISPCSFFLPLFTLLSTASVHACVRLTSCRIANVRLCIG